MSAGPYLQVEGAVDSVLFGTTGTVSMMWESEADGTDKILAKWDAMMLFLYKAMFDVREGSELRRSDGRCCLV